MAAVSKHTIRAVANSEIHPYKLVALGAGISTATGLATGAVNNIINQKYIQPRYSKSERYYSQRLADGRVVVVPHSSMHHNS